MKTSSPLLTRVLIADDSEIDRRMLVEMCERFGWEVSAVSSGGELLAAVELARDNGTLPDCLLVDWHMPHLDGLSAIGNLLSTIPEKEMPAVVIITALDAMMVEAAQAEIGNLQVLHKPAQPEGLRRVVETSISARGGQTADSRADATPAPVTSGANGWPQLRGIDIDTARTNFGGDVAFFRELCATFAESAPALLDQIAAGIPSDNRDMLRQEVHKLRGQLGTLGAVDYQHTAGEIEAALVSGFTYQVALEGLLIHVRALVEAMGEWAAAED